MANSVGPDEAAHYELPHLGLHCLQIQPFSFLLLGALNSSHYQKRDTVVWPRHMELSPKTKDTSELD